MPRNTRGRLFFRLCQETAAGNRTYVLGKEQSPTHPGRSEASSYYRPVATSEEDSTGKGGSKLSNALFETTLRVRFAITRRNGQPLFDMERQERTCLRSVFHKLAC